MSLDLISPDSSVEDATIYVVDDDDAMRESLEFLLESVDFDVRSFSSAQELLSSGLPDTPGCFLLDVRMPGMSGLDLQQEIQKRGSRMPVVMMTAYADVPMAVRAMHQGAIDFIEKPFNEQALLDCIRRAIDNDTQSRREEHVRRSILDRIKSLTPREDQVMRLVVQGRLNKQIASELNLSVKTVEQHRSRVMEKMEAETLADLVRMALFVETA